MIATNTSPPATHLRHCFACAFARPSFEGRPRGPDGQCLSGRAAAGALHTAIAEKLRHATQELRCGDRLGQDVVEADRTTTLPFVLGDERAERDDDRVARRGLRLQHLQRFETAYGRHCDIEHDEVGLPLARKIEPRERRRRLTDLVARAFQQTMVRPSYRLVVVDDQDSLARRFLARRLILAHVIPRLPVQISCSRLRENPCPSDDSLPNRPGHSRWPACCLTTCGSDTTARGQTRTHEPSGPGNTAQPRLWVSENGRWRHCVPASRRLPEPPPRDRRPPPRSYYRCPPRQRKQP